MHFRDGTDMTEFLLLFSSIMKLGIVLFSSSRKVKRNLRLFKQRKSRNSRQACSLDFTPHDRMIASQRFSNFFISEVGLKA